MNKPAALAKGIATTIVLSFSMTALTTPVFAETDSSTSAPPVVNGWVQVSTPGQLEYIDQNQSSYLASDIKLMNNIDLSYSGILYSWTPISTYSGKFNGQGHEITGWNLEDFADVNVGFFSTLQNGVIENLGIDGPVSVEYGEVAGNLVGYQGGGTIKNSYSLGTVTNSGPGGTVAGGLVGIQSGGTIMNSFAAGSVVTSYYSAGLVGISSGNIENCHATGSVTGPTYAGGLVALLGGGGNISTSYATGVVTGLDYAGGLVAVENGGAIISNSYSTGSVSGLGYSTGAGIGGLVGMLFTSASPTSNTLNQNAITDSYSTSFVHGEGHVVGGFVGNVAGNQNPGTITNSFFNTSTSDQSRGVGLGSESGVTGESTPPMQSQSLYTTLVPGVLSSPWDFTNTWRISPAINDSFPHLQLIGQMPEVPFAGTLPAVLATVVGGLTIYRKRRSMQQ